MKIKTSFKQMYLVDNILYNKLNNDSIISKQNLSINKSITPNIYIHNKHHPLLVTTPALAPALAPAPTLVPTLAPTLAPTLEPAPTLAHTLAPVHAPAPTLYTYRILRLRPLRLVCFYFISE